MAPSEAVLSDSNSELIDFLRILRSKPEEVVRAMWNWSNTEECYYRVRKSSPRTSIWRAARFLYLNKSCWGGVYRTNKKGQFNVPFGNSGRQLCHLADARAMAESLKGVSLRAEDFETAIDRSNAGDAIYADPPYTAKGENNGFIRYNERLFSWIDQERLAATCKRARKRGAFVAVSGLCHPDLKALYNGWWYVQIARQSLVSRTPDARKQVSEIVLFSRRPQMPDDSTYRAHKI
jgi:DNA adenine methylase